MQRTRVDVFLLSVTLPILAPASPTEWCGQSIKKRERVGAGKDKDGRMIKKLAQDYRRQCQTKRSSYIPLMSVRNFRHETRLNGYDTHHVFRAPNHVDRQRMSCSGRQFLRRTTCQKAKAQRSNLGSSKLSSVRSCSMPSSILKRRASCRAAVIPNPTQRNWLIRAEDKHIFDHK